MALDFSTRRQLQDDPQYGRGIYLSDDDQLDLIPDPPEVERIYKSSRTGEDHIILATPHSKGTVIDIVATEQHRDMFPEAFAEYDATLEQDGGIYPLSSIGLNDQDKEFFSGWGIASCNDFARATDKQLKATIEAHNIPNGDAFLEKCIAWRDKSRALIEANAEVDAEVVDAPPVAPKRKTRQPAA